MPDQVVTVRVKQESSGTALKDAARDAQELNKANAQALREQSGGRVSEAVALENPTKTAEILKLRKAADAYQEKGDMTAARSARAEALGHERELRNLTRARVGEEASQKRKEREEERMAERGRRERFQRLRSVGGAVEGLANGATGGTPFGGVLGAVGSMGGPIGAVIAMVVGAIGGVAAVMAERSRNAELSAIENTNARRGYDRQRSRLLGPDGGAAASYSTAQGALDEMKQREDDRERLKKEAQLRWYDVSSWQDRLSGASQKRLDDNELAISRLGKTVMQSSKDATQQFGMEGGLEMEARERRLNYDARGARDVEHMVLWRREYNRLVKEGASSEQAERGAGLAVGEAERAETQRFTRMISAKSGSRDIATAALLARGDIGGRRDPEIGTRLQELIATVKGQHMDAMNRRPHNLGRPAQ